MAERFKDSNRVHCSDFPLSQNAFSTARPLVSIPRHSSNTALPKVISNLILNKSQDRFSALLLLHHTLLPKRPSCLPSNCGLFSPDLPPFCQLFPTHLLLWHFWAVVVPLSVTLLLFLLRLFHPSLPLLLRLPPFPPLSLLLLVPSLLPLFLYTHTLSNCFCFRTTQNSPEECSSSAVTSSGHCHCPLLWPLGYNPDLPLLRMGQIPTKKKYLWFGDQWIYLSNALSLNLKINVWLENEIQSLVDVNSLPVL